MVWPSIAQIGQGRGGSYSFELLENTAGCRITNADMILTDHQGVADGDEIHLHPTAPPLRVALVEPIGFVMGREMLLGIKERAESGPVTS